MERPVALQGIRTLASLVVCAVPLGAQPTALPATPQQASVAVVHDVGFWRRLAGDSHGRPGGADELRTLALELAAYAGSPDPVLRDEIGYGLTEKWVRAGLLDDGVQRELVDLHLANALEDLGEPEGDGVFLRAFSALHLALLVARDTAQPYLDDERRAAIVDTTLELMTFEEDRRGWIEGNGWAHVVAHAADVVRRLAENEALTREQHGALLETIDAGLTGPNAWGENDRLAAALQAVARRADVELAALEQLLERWAEEGQRMRTARAFDAAAFRRAENARQVVRALHARLLVNPLGEERAAALDELVLRALRNL